MMQLSVRSHPGLHSRGFAACLLLVFLFGLLSSGQAQIRVDLEQCAENTHSFFWGLGSEQTLVLGLEILEQKGFRPETVCVLEHTTELEGGYLTIRCHFPVQYARFQADQDFNLRLDDEPFTARQALTFCERLDTGKLLLEN